MRVIKNIFLAFVAAACLSLAVSAQKPHDTPKKPPPPKIEPKPKDPPKDPKPKKPEEGYFIVAPKESNYAE